jgi:uncharacterized protein YecT (DUF1311 family)
MRRRHVRSVALVLWLACGASAATAKGPCDDAMTTVEMETCFGKQVRDARADLDRYVAEVRRLLAKADGRASSAEADSAAFEAAQKAWSDFVELDCKTVYEHGIDGTIRGLHHRTCQLGRIEERRCHLWWTYLENRDTTVKPPPCKPAE